MQYLGGKSKIRKQVCAYINEQLKPDQPYWEPFCGSCWITELIDKNRDVYASDLHPDLILLWRALQNGWMPPDVVTEKEYKELKDQSPSPLRAFAGFGCSFGGKWFGGYARDPKSDRNYALNTKNSILKRSKGLTTVKFFCADYYDRKPPPGCLIYCDPPYKDTTGYKFKFDHDRFWDWVTNKSKLGYDIYISEYQAPPYFMPVLEISTRTDLEKSGGGKLPRIERLFKYNG